MDLNEEVTQIRQRGMEKAATIWATLESLSAPIEPVNVYKACCSIKLAEFVARTLNHSLFSMLLAACDGFVDDTLKIVEGMKGDTKEGERVLAVIENDMPMTDEVAADSAAYAQRQHVYDGLILLAAAKMGKEEETKAAITRMQDTIAGVMVVSLLKRLGNLGTDTNEPN